MLTPYGCCGDLFFYSNTNEEVGLSEYEQKLCSYFQRVELKGKGGRKVAVLLRTNRTKRPICLTYYRGHQSLRKLADKCGTTQPNYLQYTQLCKEIATTSQILNLKNDEIDQPPSMIWLLFLHFHDVCEMSCNIVCLLYFMVLKTLCDMYSDHFA